MLTVDGVTALRAHISRARAEQKKIALVPTMGNLHEGHIALIQRARQRAEFVVASIFVNPLQFGPGEDFATYPRTLKADQHKLQEAGCDLLFCPSVQEVFPQGEQRQSRISVPVVSEGLCGAGRPGHFDGMATIVLKLLNMVRPDIALFGEKDYQQLAVIRAMVKGLDMPLSIIAVPTSRASDGLALSSRNGYLSDDERQRAPLLYRCLQDVAASIRAAQRVDEEQLSQSRERINAAGFQLEYLEVRNALDLSPNIAGVTRLTILLAARLGQTRLIDNLSVELLAEA